MLKLLMLLLSGAKLGPLLASMGTMLLSLAVYASLYGWRYAAGFTGLLLVHELGHYLAARQRGLKVGLPTFIPFLGAWIEMKEQPHDAETEAYVGLGGPLIGTLGALACYEYWHWMEGPRWVLAVAYAGFFLNLFNLIPLSPLDGGRITAVLSPRIWLLGVPVLGAMFWWHPSPIYVLIALSAAPQVMKAWRYRADDPAMAQYYQVSGEARLTYVTAYLGLLIFLGLMTHQVHQLLSGMASVAGGN